MADATLEQALEQIARDNDLTTIEVGRMSVADRIVWTAIVHWTGYSARNLACASGHSDTSIRDAVDAALREAVADRVAQPAIPEVLPALEVAA